MNSKMRRELRKDKDLIKGLYSIIVKYFPGLLNMFDNFTDNRNQRYIIYKIKTICTTRLNDRLRTIFKDFLDYIEYFNDTTIKNYYLDKYYKYKGHIFHMIKFNVE